MEKRTYNLVLSETEFLLMKDHVEKLSHDCNGDAQTYKPIEAPIKRVIPAIFDIQGIERKMRQIWSRANRVGCV